SEGPGAGEGDSGGDDFSPSRERELDDRAGELAEGEGGAQIGSQGDQELLRGFARELAAREIGDAGDETDLEGGDGKDVGHRNGRRRDAGRDGGGGSGHPAGGFGLRALEVRETRHLH